MHSINSLRQLLWHKSIVSHLSRSVSDPLHEPLTHQKERIPFSPGLFCWICAWKDPLSTQSWLQRRWWDMQTQWEKLGREEMGHRKKEPGMRAVVTWGCFSCLWNWHLRTSQPCCSFHCCPRASLSPLHIVSARFCPPAYLCQGKIYMYLSTQTLGY